MSEAVFEKWIREAEQRGLSGDRILLMDKNLAELCMD